MPIAEDDMGFNDIPLVELFNKRLIVDNFIEGPVCQMNSFILRCLVQLLQN